MYENSNDLCPVSLSMISGLYKHFNEAFMDFVDLQHIEYSDFFRCRCECHFENLVADGITIVPTQQPECSVSYRARLDRV
jgi:hypothetical protein